MERVKLIIHPDDFEKFIDYEKENTSKYRYIIRVIAKSGEIKKIESNVNKFKFNGQFYRVAVIKELK